MGQHRSLPEPFEIGMSVRYSAAGMARTKRKENRIGTVKVGSNNPNCVGVAWGTSRWPEAINVMFIEGV